MSKHSLVQGSAGIYSSADSIDIDYVVTDEDIDKKYIQALEKTGVKVIIG